MSYDAMEWVEKVPAPTGTFNSVMLVWAKAASKEEGRFCLSSKTTAERAKTTSRTVFKVAQWAKASGYIIEVGETAIGCKVYRFTFSEQPQVGEIYDTSDRTANIVDMKPDHGGMKPDHGGMKLGRGGVKRGQVGVKPDHPNTNLTLIEPKKDSDASHQRQAKPAEPGLFDDPVPTVKPEVAPPPQKPEHLPIRDAVYRDGIPIIRDLTGLADARARAMLGGLLKAAYDDCARVYGFLREVENLRPADPTAWLWAAAKRPRYGAATNRRDLLADEKAKVLEKLRGWRDQQRGVEIDGSVAP